MYCALYKHFLKMMYFKSFYVCYDEKINREKKYDALRVRLVRFILLGSATGIKFPFYKSIYKKTISGYTSCSI